MSAWPTDRDIVQAVDTLVGMTGRSVPTAMLIGFLDLDYDGRDEHGRFLSMPRLGMQLSGLRARGLLTGIRNAAQSPGDQAVLWRRASGPAASPRSCSKPCGLPVCACEAGP